MKTYRILYRSIVSGQLNNEEIEKLVERAREKNANLNITGILLAVGDCFMQVLEGPKEVVQELYYNQIFHDRRHSRLRVLSEGFIPERDFTNWDMGLRIFNTIVDIDEEETLDLKNRIEKDNDLVYEILKYFYRTGEVELEGFWESYKQTA